MDYFGSFGETQAEALARLEPVLETALESHESGDYEAFAQVATDDLRTKVPKENFLKAHQEVAPQLGHRESMRFLASVNRGSNPMLLYAAKYSATADDVLINVTFENRSQPPAIQWLWIE